MGGDRLGEQKCDMNYKNEPILLWVFSFFLKKRILLA